MNKSNKRKRVRHKVLEIVMMFILFAILGFMCNIGVEFTESCEVITKEVNNKIVKYWLYKGRNYSAVDLGIFIFILAVDFLGLLYMYIRSSIDHYKTWLEYGGK